MTKYNRATNSVGGLSRIPGILPKTRRAWVEIELGNLVANTETILVHSNGAQLLAVIKADAYGIGATAVARTLARLRPWGFAVATVNEGVALRKDGVLNRILVLQPAAWRERTLYRQFSLIASVDSPELVNRWASDFHIEVDTGMQRTGIPWDAGCIKDFDWGRVSGVFTHFHAADVSNESVQRQLERFTACLAAIPNSSHLVRHAANSAGIVSVYEPLDLVRPGFYLYGGAVAGLPYPRPIVSVRSRVCSIRSVAAGTSIGYGEHSCANYDTMIATIAIGYADGIPYSMADADVLIRGRRCPIVGRITMDMLMVDIGNHYPPPKIGQTATLIGCDGDAKITLAEFSQKAGTIPYEILTRLSPRLPRIYIDTEC